MSQISLTFGPLSSHVVSHVTSLNLSTSSVPSPYSPLATFRPNDDVRRKTTTGDAYDDQDPPVRVRGVIVDERQAFRRTATTKEDGQETVKNAAWRWVACTGCA